ncbi:integrase family protein / sensor/bat box HTH-10 family transcription regulator [Natronomonas moolapensis 8.8.11]|uniref:Integrase family protein / sensor/bat box HTH-10 family transcription regulator n=1 Tax=Natronomonas moolapensis (strain DSM 18674 / CECT 7526 / JCM 14361 / 8.8.11) TaxID=268739 RepID=M1XLI9_NATM8|nr:bacterio-opsin activator domain-containing protein [Natronomonas moolapensis]CCQ37801.1 integrase family protein / sensor/bat box HTH-10 family transcription regulator [Natronomonas moolapensis 8.8.11]
MSDPLGRREYEQLREAAATTRGRLVVRLLAESGVRPAEQTRIRPGDVDRRRFEGVVHHFLSVRGSDGNTCRRTYLRAELARLVDEYAATAGVAPDNRLLDVTPRRVQMLVSEVASRAAEITGQSRLGDVSSDVLRRYFARRLLVEDGIDPRIVRTIGGWNRLEALDRYLEPADDAEIAAAFSDSAPTTGGGLPFEGTAGTVGLELDADGRIVGGGGDVEGLLGYDRNAVVGTPFGRLFTDDARERARPKEVLASAGREDFTVETCWFRTAEGDRVRIVALVSRRGADQHSGFVAVLWADDDTEDGRTASTFRRAVSAAGQPICFVSPTGEIEYVNAAFEELIGYTQSEVVGRPAADILSSGEDTDAYYEELRETVLDGDPWTGQVTLRRKSGERVHVRQNVAPAGDNEVEFAVIVATDVTERIRRERSLVRRCETLEGLEGLVADINAAGRELIDASTRSEIEAAVCESLADSDAYLAAWIGGTDPGGSRLQPRAAAGAPAADESAIDIDSSVLSSALETGRPRVAGNEFPTDTLGPFGADGVSEARAVGIIPLAYGETTYGLLAVFTGRGTAFGDRERTLLSDLGAHVGHAITAIERRNLLLADTVVELEFGCTDPGAFLVAATAEHDCVCSIQAVVPVAEGSLLFYAALSDAQPDAFLDTATAASGVTDGRYIREYDDSSLLELTVEGSSPALTLTEIGATIREGVADSGEQTIRAEIAQETGVRSVVKGLQASFPETTLRAKHAADRPVETIAEFRNSLSESLTDKQRSALRAAYFSGYFDWPRGSTAEEVAESMGVSSPTLHNHLRKAERKLLSSFFDHTREHIGGGVPEPSV